MIGIAILILAVLGTIGGCCLAWPLAIAYWFHAGRLLPWTPRRHVPWSFLDLLVIILLACTLLLGIAAGLQTLRGPAGNGPGLNLRAQYISAIADSAWKVATIVLATLYLVLKAGVTWRHFGLSLRDLGRQIVIGVIAFVMIAPPVHALQVAIVLLGKWKYEHPLIKMLQDSPDAFLFVLLAFSACIMAPLSEEWLFRALLQGWLQRAFAWLTTLLDGNPAAAVPRAEEADGMQPIERLSTVAQDGIGRPSYGDDLNPYADPVAAPAIELRPASPSSPEESREEPFPRSVLAHWLPILISSVLFGLAHLGHGPAPITLTVLALGLGYIYQRTHSIVPAIVVHALFNGFSMLIFYVFMFELKLPLQ